MYHSVCDHTLEEREVGEQLLSIKQGKQHAAEYALEFCTPTAGCGWNKPALQVAFRQRLNTEVLVEQACGDKIPLDSLIDLAVCLDNLIQNCPIYHAAANLAGATK